jgi:hypothetical protein
VSLAANLASLPVVLSVFGQAPLGLIWNLLWLPMLGLTVMPLGFLGLALALLPGGASLAGLVLGLDARLIEVFLDGLHWAGLHGLAPGSWACGPPGPRCSATSCWPSGCSLGAATAGVRRSSCLSWPLACSSRPRRCGRLRPNPAASA